MGFTAIRRLKISFFSLYSAFLFSSWDMPVNTPKAHATAQISHKFAAGMALNPRFSTMRETLFGLQLECQAFSYSGRVYASVTPSISFYQPSSWLLGFDHGFFPVDSQGLKYTRIKFSGDYSCSRKKNKRHGGCSASYYLNPYFKVATGPSWWQEIPNRRYWHWQCHVGFEIPLVSR